MANEAENKDHDSEVEVNDEQQEATSETTEPHAEAQSDPDTDNEETIENTELIEAQEEIAKLKDAFLRSKAEEDNVRRRAEKEVANARKFAVEGFAKEMLTVVDSLKLATANEPDDDADQTVKSIYEGSMITLNQLLSAFTKFSIKEIKPEVGDKLDPNLHQAMSLVESEEVESGHIITVIQSGFELHDRLLRPSMVVVAK